MVAQMGQGRKAQRRGRIGPDGARRNLLVRCAGVC
jgi:hypothetical protein